MGRFERHAVKPLGPGHDSVGRDGISGRQVGVQVMHAYVGFILVIGSTLGKQYRRMVSSGSRRRRSDIYQTALGLTAIDI